MISVSGPQMDVSWSVNPMNTVRSIINHSQNGVMFFWMHHIVGASIYDDFGLWGRSFMQQDW